VDDINIFSVIYLTSYRLFHKIEESGKEVLVIGDMYTGNFSYLLIKCLNYIGYEVGEAKYYAGHMLASDGGNLWVSSQQPLSEIAWKVANDSLISSRILSELNAKWGKNTIEMFIAKVIFKKCFLSNHGHRTILKIMIADALSRESRNKGDCFLVHIPMGLEVNYFYNVTSLLNLKKYKKYNFMLRESYFFSPLAVIVVEARRLISYFSDYIFTVVDSYGDISKPGVVLLQEDDLSLDRSYRSQPSWIFKDRHTKDFRTLILEFNPVDDNALSELAKYDIFAVHKNKLYSYPKNHIIQKMIMKSLRSLVFGLFTERTYNVMLLNEFTVLMLKASLLAGFFKSNNIKTFMTGENYHIESDAALLIGRVMGMNTLSYQYSNMHSVLPIMQSTADKMFTFSPLFHSRYKLNKNSIGPSSFMDIGYIYDSSFNLLKQRSLSLRKKMLDKGVSFVICYFDENVQHNDFKMGIYREQDNYNDILALCNYVIEHHDIAVIIKSQFKANTPSILHRNSERLKQAANTGRLLELQMGEHRNNVFPAEAAMSADLVIGHSIGSTASLESVLAGTRSILLYSNEITSNIEIFKRQNILYDDMHSALSAVSHYKDGNNEYLDLGNWDEIISLFDPFRDNKSADRMYEYIKKVTI